MFGSKSDVEEVTKGVSSGQHAAKSHKVGGQNDVAVPAFPSRMEEAFSWLQRARTPALSEILSSANGSVIIQGRIRALQKLLRGARRQSSASKQRSTSPTSDSDREEESDPAKPPSRPGSPVAVSSSLITNQSRLPCTVPARSLTPTQFHQVSAKPTGPSSSGSGGAPHTLNTSAPSQAVLLVPPCMRRCLTPIERQLLPSSVCPETRINVPRFKKAWESPAAVFQIRQQRETAKSTASYEKGAHVALRIRTALLGGGSTHDVNQRTNTVTPSDSSALNQSVANRAKRGHSIDLSLFPTVVGADLRLATQEELKFLRAVQARAGLSSEK